MNGSIQQSYKFERSLSMTCITILYDISKMNKSNNLNNTKDTYASLIYSPSRYFHEPGKKQNLLKEKGVEMK